VTVPKPNKTLLFRPVQRKDLTDIVHLVQQSGVGITTLPANKTVLCQHIERSKRAFAKRSSCPEDENYFFALEDVEQQCVIGVAAIDAVVGGSVPFYSYKLSKVLRVCTSLALHKEYQILNLVNDYQNKTAICSLFLHPDYRSSGNGCFLSRARFLFMAVFKQRFSDLVIADMRGVSDNL